MIDASRKKMQVTTTSTLNKYLRHVIPIFHGCNQFMAIGLRLLIWGSLAGIVGAWWTSRAMRSVLYDVLAMQGPTLIFAFTIVCAVTILACLVPARRAAMVDPITALRAD